jgi:hypothetical protein
MRKTPPNRRTFRSIGDELNYLNDKVCFWWRQRGLRARAMPFVKKMETLLAALPEDDPSIAWADHRALVHEARGDLKKAALWRKRQIQSIRRLLEIGGPVGNVDHAYLASVLLQLAVLSAQAEDPSAALGALHEAKSLADTHGFAFHGRELLQALAPKSSGTRLPA